MPLVTTKEMLLAARAGRYAVGAFNVENMEMAQAAVEAASELRAPLILQTTPSTVRYGSLALYRGMAAALAQSARIPVAIHLDHGDSRELAAAALAAGYGSVMIDGSRESLEENIALTRRVVEDAEKAGVPVEAELGKVGGREDGMDGGPGGYTDPEEAAGFVSRTGAASLAVAIGTAHGVYAGVPVLDIGLLGRIRRAVPVPLVLHGASGLSDDQVRRCVAEGICKVNFATELRIAYTEGVRERLSEKPGAFDPKDYGGAGRERVKRVVMDRIRVCGCCAKA